jgi:hypothetical protein
MMTVKAILLIDIITEHVNEEIYIFREYYNMIRRIYVLNTIRDEKKSNNSHTYIGNQIYNKKPVVCN